MRAISILAVLSMFLFPAISRAQVPVTNACPADAPVALLPTSASTSPQDHPLVAITNRSTKPITAVILVWRITDSTGAYYNTTSTVDFAPSGVLFEPGKNSQSEGDLTIASDRTLKSVEVSCLAVLYQGKEVWGDKNAPEVARLRAMRQGIAAERKRLLSIYTRDGAAKLVDELNRPMAR